MTVDADQGEGPGRLARLVALRNAQAALLGSGEVPAREFSALSREYRATLAEISDLTPKEKAGDPVDEITARRARRAGSA